MLGLDSSCAAALFSHPILALVLNDDRSYGVVYKAKHIASGKLCAVKQIPVENDLEDVIKEINVMTGFDSPHLVQFYASYLTDDTLWVRFVADRDILLDH